MACNKENFGKNCYRNNDNDKDPDDSDSIGLPVIGSKRPSISAPISSKKSCNSSSNSSRGAQSSSTPPSSPKLLPISSDLCDGAVSSTPKRHCSSSPLTSDSLEDGDDLKLRLKHERMDTDSSPEVIGLKKSRVDVVNAQSGTLNNGGRFLFNPYLLAN